jgi:hypothetical protein
MAEFFKFVTPDGKTLYLNVAQICLIEAQPDGSAKLQMSNKDDAVFNPATWAEFQQRFNLSPPGKEGRWPQPTL